MDENLKDQDILLVKEKSNDKLLMANMDKEGKVKSARFNDAGNPDFLKIDRNANVLENFFENFNRQVKNPTEFEFFRVPAEKFQEAVKKLQDAFHHPENPQNKEFIDMHRLDPDWFLKNKDREQSQSTSSGNAIAESRIDWSQFEKIGITRESLEKTGNLEKLLNWQKTDLLPVSLKFDGITLRTDARLALRNSTDDKLTLTVHALRREPELERPYFGVKFTDEDKQNLLKTGNLGRIVQAEYSQGEKTPVVISIDKQTSELVAFRADRMKIPDTIKGVQLNELQKKELLEGKAVFVENMLSKKNTPFNAYVQFNADKRGIEFRFDSDKKQEQTRKQDTEQKDVPKTFRKKVLTGDERSSLREGKTVYTGELTDGKGKKYSGYITLNMETGKTDFMFPKDYKDALAAGKVIPDDRHKTQVAVNSEGKNSEATKNLKEPLEKGQTKPSEKQAEKQKEKMEKKQEKPKQSKGQKR